MIEVLLLAVALSMDAFAVSVGVGVKNGAFNRALAIKVALFFGIFQGLMPLFGHLANMGVDKYISFIDHWIAFVLLSLIGAKMVYESFGDDKEEEISKITNRVLLMLSIATSIDALGAGFTLSLLSLNPFISMLLIAVITFCFSYVGVFIGTKGGSFLEKKAEFVGGIVLILIGFKILLEHTIFS